MKKIILEGLNVKHYTHTDLDGIFPAILMKRIIDNNPRAFKKGSQRYFYIQPNELYNEIEKTIVEIKEGECDLVIITDLTFNLKEYSLIHNFALDDHFLVFDHHISDLFPKYTSEFKTDNITIQTHETIASNITRQTCGTKIFYDYLIKCGYIDEEDSVSNSIATLVELVRLRDTYEFTLPMNINNPLVVNAPRLNTLFYLLGEELFIEYLINFNSEDYSSVFKGNLKYPYIATLLNNAEKAESIYIQKRAKAATIKKITVDSTEYTIAIAFAENSQSEVGKVLYDNGADIAVMVGANACSLRTKKGSGIDLSKIAKKLGGGGHVESAGFPINDEIISSILNTIKYGIE